MQISQEEYDKQISISQSYEEIDGYVTLVIQTAGLVGHVLMFLAYSRGHLRALSVSVYFRALAFFGTFRELTHLLAAFVHVEHTLVFCALKFYMYFMIKTQIAWFEIIAGLDRLITIVFPNKSRIIQRGVFKYLTVAWLILANFSFYTGSFIETQWLVYDSQRKICSPMFEPKLNVIDVLVGTAIPFVSMLGLSITTLVGVLKAHNRIKSERNKSTQHRRLRRDIKFGVTMIVLNLMFFFLNFPFRFYFVYDFNPFDPRTHLGYNLIFIFVLMDLQELYLFCLFYVQLLVNKFVRKELLNVFKSILGLFLNLVNFLKMIIFF